MIRFQLTTINPIAINTAAKILTEHPHGQEARFCVDCVPAVLRHMKVSNRTNN